LVERRLPKPKVAGSRPVVRSQVLVDLAGAVRFNLLAGANSGPLGQVLWRFGARHHGFAGTPLHGCGIDFRPFGSGGMTTFVCRG
jgi:hypothetical protein